ncbi:hypothetical protein, partial [Klebsiella pneumoniae]|uniref:hypothetical protein n=1 Tax=Klebsiella pneumoniae TaxID=573 RepID=UPI0040558E08
NNSFLLSFVNMVMRSLIIFTVGLLLHVSSGEDAFNKMIDRVLVKLEDDLNNRTNQLVVELPDAIVPFKKNLFKLDLNGLVELQKGKVQSMSG